MEDRIVERLGGGEEAERLAQLLVCLNDAPQPERRRIYQGLLEVLLYTIAWLLRRAA